MIKRALRTFSIWCINNIFAGTRFFGVKRKLLKLADIPVGKNTKVVGPIYIGGVAKLTIGDNSWIGKNMEILGNGSVTIGDGCDIAPLVTFATGSHIISTNPKRRAGEGISFEINIENGCWIGVNTIITNNINIESGSVVGACSLVNKTISENTVCFGVPAKEHRKIETDEEGLD